MVREESKSRAKDWADSGIKEREGAEQSSRTGLPVRGMVMDFAEVSYTGYMTQAEAQFEDTVWSVVCGDLDMQRFSMSFSASQMVERQASV